MPLGATEDHIIFGSKAEETLQEKKAAIIAICQTMARNRYRHQKYSRKHGFVSSSDKVHELPFSILKTTFGEDKVRYFALNNHLIDSGSRSQKEGALAEGVGSTAFAKPMREIIPTIQSGQITDVSWASIASGERRYGLKRERKGNEINPSSPIFNEDRESEQAALKEIDGSDAVTELLYASHSTNATQKLGIVLPWYSGGELYALTHSDEKWPPEKVLKLVIACLDMLVALHDKGWLHRDIKSENICLDDTGNPHFIDYAFSRKKLSDGTFKGKVVGTQEMFEPELVNAARRKNNSYTYTEKTDCFAMGKTIEEILSLLELGHQSENVVNKLSKVKYRMVNPFAANRWDARKALSFLKPKIAPAPKKSPALKQPQDFKVQLKNYLFSNEMLDADIDTRKNKLGQLTKNKFSKDNECAHLEQAQALVAFITAINYFYANNQKFGGLGYSMHMKLLKIYIEMLAKKAHAFYQKKQGQEKTEGIKALKTACGMSVEDSEKTNIKRFGAQKNHLIHQHRDWFRLGIFGRSLTTTAKHLQVMFDDKPKPETSSCFQSLWRCLFGR
ncbi:MAG: hypothetical protein DHS20C10_12650 [marine bacterium B5-7]|nr:MAG: hypothetical protein DHS20C10_12650 [marine bacterium B5-7]